ncbi:MAG: hypothetical protein II879_04705 [Clostridia bacterium]|nr:hypothetical protein [Clostridia bacterium]
MKNLIKYEFRKTWGTKLIILVITACMELAFLISLYLDKENFTGISAVFLTFLAFGGILFIGIQSILTMHQDMNTKQGYMLYMTPNSCYKILGGKVIENGLSIFVAGAFFFVLGVLDVTLLFGHYGQLDQLMEFVTDLMKQLRIETTLDWRLFLALTVSFLCGWLSTVITAYLADVVATCLLNGKKHNGWIALLLFILINWGVTSLQQVCTRNMSWIPAFYLDAAIAIGFSVLMYLATAMLMDRHLSV